MKRPAFTLIELLVVIVIITILTAILVVAVAAARETARRNQCLTNQRSLAIAMIDYSTAHNGLPGYLNRLGQTPVHSWAVSIMPRIGENRRYEVLMNNSSTPAEIARAIAPLAALLCPSDNPREDARLNYVVNCGPYDDGLRIRDTDALHFMLFRDRRFIRERATIEDIPNGASNTILLSENLDAGVWRADWSSTDDRGDDLLNNASGQYLRSREAVRNLGFIWARHSDYLPNSSANVPRPSSRHPGAVIAAFADGTARPIHDDISSTDWLRAVCVDYETWLQQGL